MYVIFVYTHSFLDTALTYKEMGNKNVAAKNYPLAIENYTEGIKCKSSDNELNAILYSNRAAAYFWLGKLILKTRQLKNHILI